MAANIIIQGVNYKEIETSVDGDNNWDIIPFDFGGKPLTEMTIWVDTNDDGADIYLPEISSFNGVFGTTIKIIAPYGDENSALILASGTDKIGSLPSVSLNDNGENAIFTVAAEGYWSVLKTN